MALFAARGAGTSPALASGMRLRVTLLQIAVFASTGCGGATASSTSPPDGGSNPDGSKEAAAGDASMEGGQPEAACGGCGCTSPAVPSGNANSAQACAIAAGDVGSFGFSAACDTFCEALNNGGGSYFCSLPQDYLNAYRGAQPDAGDGGYEDAGADAGPVCPPWSGDVVVGCGYNCTGRRTAGARESGPCDGATPGSILAERAYLEAVSVHAFATLERELAAHGAPPSLLRDVRRARRDEVRHVAMMSRLAGRHDGVVRTFAPPAPSPVRGLLAIAMENAVEGCVRETYGAVVGLIEARSSSDPEVRRAMRSIAPDECRHAELAWAVAAWILPRLTAREREAIDQATRETISSLAREGDAGLVALLVSRVWQVPGGLALSA
jgi:hypothetical protein